MRVDEIMTRDVHGVVADVDAEAAWHHMRRCGVRHLVVLGEGDALVGIVSDRDFGAHEALTLARRTVRELMTSQVVVGSAEMDVREAAKLLRDHVISCLPIASGTQVVGVITTMDLLTLIVGDRDVGHSTDAGQHVEVVRGGRILRS